MAATLRRVANLQYPPNYNKLLQRLATLCGRIVLNAWCSNHLFIQI